nr:hypothetical protein [Saccharofermentans sp.]
MIKNQSTRRLFGLIATTLVASVLSQWLLIPSVQWNSKVYADGEWDPNSLDTVSHVNYSSILGRGVDYGIIASHISQTSHMETTFATNLFSSDNRNSCDVDFQDRNVVAHFMIGAIDEHMVGDDTGSEPSCIRLSYPSVDKTVDTMVFQAPESIFTTSVDRSIVPDAQGLSFNQAYYDSQGEPSPRWGYNGPYFRLMEQNWPTLIVPDYNSNTGTEVTNLINRITGSSGASATLGNHNGYAALPYTYTDSSSLEHNYIVLDDSNKTVTINIDEECFDDSVVYIDVDATMLEYMMADNNHLFVNKRPSTVVVFNISDAVVNSVVGDGTLITRQYHVNTTYNGIDYSMDTRSPWSGDRDGTPGGADAATMDLLLCQKFIWNIQTDNNVTLGPVAGVMLLPNSPEIDFADPPCGWLIANGHVTVNKEFHYLYNSSSGNALGQMNFSIEKRFTDEFADKTSVTELSYSFTDGDFQFVWQEYSDSTFTTTVGSDVSEGAIDQGFTNFDALRFYSDTNYSADPHYVALNQYVDFYYKISEDPNSTVSGVTNSGGCVLIRLRVFNNNGLLQFFVQSHSTTGENGEITYFDNGVWLSDEWHPGETQNSNYWVQVSGNYNFSLGGFYNRIDTNPTPTATLTVDKVFDGDTVTGSFYYTVYNGSQYLQDDGSFADDVHYFSITENASTNPTHTVPYGTYTVTEYTDTTDTARTAQRDGYTLVVTYDDGSDSTNTITFDANTTAGTITIHNNYSQNSTTPVPGTLTIDKVIGTGNAYTSANTQTYTFYVYSESNGTRTYYDVAGTDCGTTA